MCSRPVTDDAAVRVELKPRLPWYGLLALLLFALFMLVLAAWLFFCAEPPASALWLPCIALIMGLVMVGTLLYLQCGRKFLLMSREETLYNLRFLAYSSTRSFSTSHLRVDVRRSEWEYSGDDKRVCVSYEVYLSSLGDELKIAEFPKKNQALSLCRQIESERDGLIS